ncbi:MAG TPA: efflux RND transporter periplasmic adaptor subunit [Methylomirabilota bacterium]|nr:efflux RND transporter periplasmic adaptor subunit [Methylomirabilota bacterium]
MAFPLTLLLAVFGFAFSALPVRAQTLDCLITPSLIVAVSFATEGVLDAVTVDRGDLVKEGQVLATLESSVEKATIALAAARARVEASLKSNQVRLEFGVRRFVRTDELYKKDLIPLKEFDEAETQKILAEIGVLEAKENRELAELDVERARAALAQRTLRSPVTGVVTERLLSPGEFVRGTAIVKVAKIDPLHVEVITPVAMLGKIAVGMRVEVLPEAPVGRSHPATVTVVDRVVDAASGTFGVRLALPNPDYRLPAGLKCKVRFTPGPSSVSEERGASGARGGAPRSAPR